MSHIRISLSAGVGEIILDRPKALNALDKSMIDEMHDVLRSWGDDSAVESVLITSASERAFCAGGDIRAIRDAALNDDTRAVTEYFTAEYRLDQLVAEYPKPYVSLIDGPAMGGGLGISVHGEIRIVTERAVMAMPEAAIGFFPDVGATYFLPRLPDGVGMWLGLTGTRIIGAQAVAIGLATHAVTSAELPALAESIRAGTPLAEVLAGREAPPASPLPLEKVAQYFDDDNAAAIVGGLLGAAGAGDDWAQQQLDALAVASPTSLAVTAAMLTAGASSQLDACLERELHAAERITATNDFVEGVRAVLVDKDRDPTFVPATLADVDPDVVAAIVS